MQRRHVAASEERTRPVLNSIQQGRFPCGNHAIWLDTSAFLLPVSMWPPEFFCLLWGMLLREYAMLHLTLTEYVDRTRWR